ncbi:hypothetical protein IWQ56_005218 [Coemansia nantahalensis]|uniref:Uncharacterized protein n=2 Tax=Coemansia TaxID=4863 RepID=A0ACC1L234_9FUNG|nr:hypothetical protein IWQ56_005218 [Coemansia nantahalensis]KAJ2771740.1 hypothetical protein IWQ57_002075 [Coemansia nantahalensis]KAJ2798937.1 hypothetical protein H4R21_003728 [Coemansia helicoidea]
MKCVAALAALVAAVAAQQHPAATPVVKANAEQEAAMASLSSVQNHMNVQNSMMIAADKASQEAALHSISQAAHGQQSGSGVDEESSEMDSDDIDGHLDSGAGYITSSVLALVAVLGAAMF